MDLLMIKPDKEAAIKKIRHLHEALDGVIMCCSGADNAHRLAVVLRGELRQVLRLLGDEEE